MKKCETPNSIIRKQSLEYSKSFEGILDQQRKQRDLEKSLKNMKISGKTSLIKSFILRNNITGSGHDDGTVDDASQCSYVLLDELQKNIEEERKIDRRNEKATLKLRMVKKHPAVIIESGNESCNSSPDVVNQCRPKLVAKQTSSPLLKDYPGLLGEPRKTKLESKKLSEKV